MACIEEVVLLVAYHPRIDCALGIIAVCERARVHLDANICSLTRGVNGGENIRISVCVRVRSSKTRLYRRKLD